MTIMLFKDGSWVIDDGNPIERSLDGLVLMLDGSKAGESLAFDGNIWGNAVVPAVLYVNEAAGEDDAVVLTKTYAEIKAAVGANKAVYVASVSSGTNTLVPLATYGGNDDDGYTVTAGSDTYTAETADGTLTKQAAGGEG